MLLNGATHMLFTMTVVELSTDEVPPSPVVAKSAYIIVGISMYQVINGDFYPLKNNPYNAMTSSRWINLSR
ncbi:MULTISPECIES: hypothetical protein [Sphingobacterium]|uniref:hypothetical protein n=1 Tax=Sphingobacterium TaxID=28453 RepID=UPI000E9C22FB|nr:MULTISPECIES: hypothetical protein [Sphingobacterium]HBW79194.1 hypothetical protein [Sphingobacterium sp.]